MNAGGGDWDGGLLNDWSRREEADVPGPVFEDPVDPDAGGALEPGAIVERPARGAREHEQAVAVRPLVDVAADQEPAGVSSGSARERDRGRVEDPA